MKKKLLLSLLIASIVTPLLTSQEPEPSKYGWAANFRNFYHYIFNKPRVIEPTKPANGPVGLQIVPHIEPYKIFPYKIFPSLRVVNMLSKLPAELIQKIYNEPIKLGH